MLLFIILTKIWNVNEYRIKLVAYLQAEPFYGCKYENIPNSNGSTLHM